MSPTANSSIDSGLSERGRPAVRKIEIFAKRTISIAARSRSKAARFGATRLPERTRRLVFASVGGLVGTAIDISILAALAERGSSIALAAFLGSIAGAGFCFVINKYIAFRDHRPLDLRQLGNFAMVAGTTAVLMAGAMFVACDLGHAPYLLGKVICSVVVFLLWSYPAQRRLVFVVSN